MVLAETWPNQDQALAWSRPGLGQKTIKKWSKNPLKMRNFSQFLKRSFSKRSILAGARICPEQANSNISQAVAANIGPGSKRSLLADLRPQAPGKNAKKNRVGS